MKAFIILSAVTLAGHSCFALSMTPRLPQANANPAPRLTTPVSPPRPNISHVSTNGKPMLARVTVYWAGGGKGSDRFTRQHKTATGCRLQSGHCAVDPRHVPYGSQIILSDGTKLAAVDTGSAVRTRSAARRAGRTAQEKNAIVVDRFFETKRQALAWAKTHPLFMPVQIVTPRSSAVAQTQTIAATPPKYAIASNRPAPAGALNKLRN